MEASTFLHISTSSTWLAMTDNPCRDQDCPKRHCYTCNARHIDAGDQTCIWCLGLARRWLRAIPDHAAQISTGFGIANLSFGIPNDGTGGGHNATKDRPLPGGASLVMLGPGSDHGEYQHHVKPGDAPEPTPVLWLLYSWERDWRETISGTEPTDTDTKATLTTVTTYLLDNLTWAARHHPAFDEFQREVRAIHNALEHAAGMSQRPVIDKAHCQHCPGVRLQREWTDRTYDKRTGEVDDHGGLDTKWSCPHCERRYTEAEYWLAVRQQAEVAESLEVTEEATC